MADVFISYSHQDSDYAHRLAGELRSRQIDVWIDDRIDYGDQWPRVIQENLAACRVFIVMMSPRSFDSMWVQNEVSYAHANRKSIFPLLLEGEVWLSLSAMQFVDVRTGEMPPEKFFERLGRELNKPVAPPRPPVKPLQRPGRIKSRQLALIGGSLLFFVALSCVLLFRLWDYFTPNPTQPPVEITTAPPEPPIMEGPTITSPSPEPTPTPLYEAGVITLVTRTETGQVLYILERDGSQRPLLEEPGMQGLKVLSVSPPSNDPSAPRYLAVSFVKDNLLNLVVLNIKEASAVTISQVTIAQESYGVGATYLEGGRLLVEIKDGNIATHSLYQMDGSNPVVIYTTVLTLPESAPVSSPEAAP